MDKKQLHPVDEASFLVGGRNALASLLGVSVTAIGNWKTRGVPLEQCVPIERATHGAVTRKDLRPDDYLDVWPELAGPTAVLAPALPMPSANAVTTDPVLEADLADAERAGLVKLPKKPEPWNGIERRVAQQPRRVCDRTPTDIAGA